MNVDTFVFEKRNDVQTFRRGRERRREKGERVKGSEIKAVERQE